MVARSVAYLCVVLVLVGSVAGQLGFQSDWDIQPRHGYKPQDTMAPCGGRESAGRSITNTSTFSIQFNVVGNRGLPNRITLRGATIIEPQLQTDFEPIDNMTIPDGVLQEYSFNATMAKDTIKTYQLEYETGSAKFYYCFDVQYGDYNDIQSSAVQVTYATVLALFAVLCAVAL